jgi:hypothetical protein
MAGGVSAIRGGPNIHWGGRDGGSTSVGGLPKFGALGIGPNGFAPFGTGVVGVWGIHHGIVGASDFMSCSGVGAAQRSSIDSPPSTELGSPMVQSEPDESVERFMSFSIGW